MQSKMTDKKNIFVIIGSASTDSANEKLVDNFANLTKDFFRLTVFKDLKTLPHFDPELSTSNPPKEVVELRNKIERTIDMSSRSNLISKQETFLFLSAIGTSRTNESGNTFTIYLQGFH